MAGAALLAVAVWVGGALALRGTDLVDGNAFTVGAGIILVAPLALPSAFAVGTAVWRYAAPERPTPRRGAVLGAVTAIGSLLASAGGAATFLTYDYATSTGMGAPSELLVIPALLAFGLLMAVIFATIFAGWLVVPVGAVCGWIHERARRRDAGA